ncbi:MAG: SHOCT domain-containing protein [Pseudarthrobacter sp.]
MMWGYGQGMGWMWLWGLMTLVGIGILVLLAVRLFAGGTRGGDAPQGGPGSGAPPMGRSRARQILDERFAAGEITADQYREQLKVLAEGQ